MKKIFVSGKKKGGKDLSTSYTYILYNTLEKTRDKIIGIMMNMKTSVLNSYSDPPHLPNDLIVEILLRL